MKSLSVFLITSLLSLSSIANCNLAIIQNDVVVVPEYKYLEERSNFSLAELSKKGLGKRYTGLFEFNFRNSKIEPGDRVFVVTAFRYVYGQEKNWLFQVSTEMNSDQDSPSVWRASYERNFWNFPDGQNEINALQFAFQIIKKDGTIWWDNGGKGIWGHYSIDLPPVQQVIPRKRWQPYTGSHFPANFAILERNSGLSNVKRVHRD